MWLLLLSAAQAFDPDSLRSDATFGLFRDEYDYLREPATLSEQAGTHVYTVLGNQGGTGRFSLGALGPVGPGVVGFIGELGTEGTSASTRADVAATALDPATITETRTDNRARDLAGFLGYGVPVGSRFALGAGVALADARWRATLAPRPGSVPVIGGTLRHVTAEGADRLLQEGTWAQDTREARVVLGAAWLGDRFDLEADVHVTRMSSSTRGEALEITPTTEYTFAGYLPNAGLEGNLSGSIPGFALDLVAELDGGVALRIFAEGERGRVEPVVTESFEGFEDDTRPETPITWDRYERLEAPDMRVQGGEALVAVQLTRGDVAVWFGVAAIGEAEDLVVRRVVESTAGEVTVTVETREAARQGYRAIALPIATEVAASDRFVARFGGRWVNANVRFEGVERLLGDAAEGDLTRDVRSSAATSSYVELAVGFRWLAADAFSLDAAALGIGVPDERIAIDLTQLQLSGVFHF